MRQLLPVLCLACYDPTIAASGDPDAPADAPTDGPRSDSRVDAGACPGVVYEGHCFFRISNVDSWHDAIERCLDEGAHLASFVDKFDTLAVRELLGQDYWIGLSDGVTEGAWRWVTTEPYKDSWLGLAPDGGADENCVISADGNWYDRGCLEAGWDALCEDPGWYHEPDGDHEFKVFYDLVSWPDAIDRCVARGASLATIPAPEDDVLSSLTAASWIGLEDMATEGMWRWITGEPLGPTFWDSGEPSDGTFQNCGAAVAEGWHDRACDILLPYLCER